MKPSASTPALRPTSKGVSTLWSERSTSWMNQRPLNSFSSVYFAPLRPILPTFSAKSCSPTAFAISSLASSAATYIEPSQELGLNSSMSSVWCWRPESTPDASPSQRSGLSLLQAYSTARFTLGHQRLSHSVSPDSFQSRNVFTTAPKCPSAQGPMTSKPEPSGSFWRKVSPPDGSWL